MSDRELIDLFIRTIERAKCAKTARAYSNGLEKLYRWLDGRPLCSMGTAEFTAFLDFLESRGYAKNTQALIMNSLRSIWAWLAKQGMVKLSEDLIPIPEPEQKESAFMEPSEYSFLISHLNDFGNDLRDKAIIALYFRTGLRASELASLKITDLDIGRSSFKVKTLKQRKGADNIREANIAYDAAQILSKWLTERDKELGSRGKDCAAVFITLDRSGGGNPLGVRSIQRMFKSRCRKLGMRPLTPKACRHGFVTEAIRRSMPITYVAKQVGHKRISTTTRYEHGKDDDVRKAFIAAFACG